MLFVTALIAANLAVLNLWVANLGGLRIDLTEGKKYSLSQATDGYLRQLREPLLIRGYFSHRTHPALMPLVPEMEDLLHEYALAGGDKVRVEIIDPSKDPEAENEANSKYGIRPVPFPVGDRYESSLVNSYFDVLISYGDEYEVLNFRDLIEVKVLGEADYEVRLQNPEYDLTRSIKKVLFGFQGGGDIFTYISEPVQFVGYFSPDETLPVELVEFRQVLQPLLEEMASTQTDKFNFRVLDPDAGTGELAERILADYGFQPMAVNFLDPNAFYFYLTLTQDDMVVQLPIPEALSQDAMRKVLKDGLARFATGLLKTVGLVVPIQPPPAQYPQGYPPQRTQVESYGELERVLTNDFAVERVDLSSGVVAPQIDLLMVVDSVALDAQSVYAIDQYLMRGGNVVLATGALEAAINRAGVQGSPRASGLRNWLDHYGVSMANSFVMDPVNAALAVPVTREAGGFSFQDIIMIDYPYFIDVRDGLNDDHPVTGGLDQITIPWASNIEFAKKNFEGVDTRLLTSSNASWLSEEMDLSPKLNDDGTSGFVNPGAPGEYLLALLLEGNFISFFKAPPQESSLENTPPEVSGNDVVNAEPVKNPQISSTILRSPESARLLVVSSNNFLSDAMLQMIGSAEGKVYSNSLQMMVNTVDWALEDQNLLSIRSRSHFNRTLHNFAEGEQAVWETLNYALALFGLLCVFVVFRISQRKKMTRYQELEN